MTRKDGSHSEEAVLRAEEAYLSDPSLTLEMLSDMSPQLIGEFVPPDKIKKWSSERKWRAKRQMLPAPADDISKEVQTVRSLIFRQIVAESESGLMLSGEFDKALVGKLLKDIDGLSITEFSPRGINPAMINAYMNLLQKSNVDLRDTSRSAKTELQRAIELAREAVEEHEG